MARLFNQMMNQVMHNMCETNEEMVCNVFGLIYRERIFGIFPNKGAEMFAGISTAGNLMIYYNTGFGTNQVTEVYPLSKAVKLKIKGPNMLGINRIFIKFKINGKTQKVDMMIAHHVDNSDLNEQPKNVDRMILELRRRTKLV